MKGGPAPRAVALVGLRCSGKTSVGRRLAELCALPFADLDDELARLHAEERGDGSPPAAAGALLAELGEPAFRALEERALERALAEPVSLVLATGGGAVESARNRRMLRERARVAWLRVDPAELRRRMASDPTERPALTAAGALGEIEELARRREPLYAELASVRVEAGARSVDAIARELARRLDAGA